MTLNTQTTTLTYQAQQTYFYMQAASHVPVAVTIHAIKDTTVEYVIADGAADPFRMHAEPKFLFERGIQRGTEVMQEQADLLKPDQQTSAILYARLRAVLDLHRMLTQEETERVGIAVKVGSKPGSIAFAQKDNAGDWHYFVRIANTVSIVERSRSSFTPLNPIPGEATTPTPVPAPEPTPVPTPVPAAPQPAAPFTLPDLPPAVAPAQRSQYKGWPTLTIFVKDEKDRFNFGRAKAVAILQNLEAIIAFVNDPASSAQPEKKGTSPKA